MQDDGGACDRTAFGIFRCLLSAVCWCACRVQGAGRGCWLPYAACPGQGSCHRACAHARQLQALRWGVAGAYIPGRAILHLLCHPLLCMLMSCVEGLVISIML